MYRISPAGTPLGDEFHLYDTTLRDGAQREGISYSVADKLAVARLLDTLGVGFIEGGWPGALPKDTEFFARARAGELTFQHAVLVAFGSTRRAALKADQDPQVQALLASGAPVITLVAKSDRRHVERALRVDVPQACAMVADTVALLVSEGRRVFLDAEHFFDGYAFDADCALRVLESGMTAGADVVVLCDTNGGQLPLQLAETVAEVVARTGFRVGIHCQDDTACAVANSVAAVQAGATHVQCTANGYGERAGNADLFAVVGNLATKLGMPVLPEHGMAELTRASHALAEIANLAPDTHQAYVGKSAFAHKAGLHASAIKVDPELYNHLDPAVVGNSQRVLVTEMAGRASIELKAGELGLDLAGRSAELGVITARVKELESRGWSFEAADASFELLLRHEIDEVPPAPPFALESYRVIIDHTPNGTVVAQATVTVHVAGERVLATAEGNGPVNALDGALRQALSAHLPWLDAVELSDYKVRILPGTSGTDAVTRVLVETSDGSGTWTTVGVHGNVVEASWLALLDALTYAALRHHGVARTG
ncbi:MAG TPA: citramalate synthase [Pseudonocardiaceae bacterium]|nr:citramalate synthase [Pseudonocardiaceae bacterium]